MHRLTSGETPLTMDQSATCRTCHMDDHGEEYGGI
jgi:hypothetical protein